jgi:ABC-2 type transport system permease protein
MQSYRGLFKMSFKGELQYRAKAISGISTQLFWGLLYVYLYTAFMKGNAVDGFSISQMASFVWLGQAFFVLRYINLPNKCAKEIENGDVCYKFVRPINLYNQWYFEHLGFKLSATLLRFLPIVIIAFLLPSSIGLSLPVSVAAFVLFIITLVSGALLTSAISMIVVYLTFKTLSAKGVQTMVNTLCGLLGGFFIPIPLMPTPIQNVLNYLPFRFIVDLPFRIYIGSIGIKSALMFSILSFVWLIVLVALGKFLMTKALKKTIIQGG